nr:hypothetical protein [Tanacetum cinerariifolium]
MMFAFKKSTISVKSSLLVGRSNHFTSGDEISGSMTGEGQQTESDVMRAVMRYFDVDFIVRKLVMNRLGPLLKNFKVKLRQTYILPNQNTLSKLNAVPTKYSVILKAKEWVNFVKYTATKEYKVKSATAKMARSKSVYQHTMGRGGYALVKEKMDQKKEIKPDEEPVRGTLWLKGRLNKDGIYPDDEIRSVEDKLVSLVDINPINSNGDVEGRTTVVGCENDSSIQMFIGLATLEQQMERSATHLSIIQKNVENKTAPKLHTKHKTFTSLVTRAKGSLEQESSEVIKVLRILLYLKPEVYDETKHALDITIRVTNVISVINLRVAFYAINARRLSLALLVYTMVRPS